MRVGTAAPQQTAKDQPQAAETAKPDKRIPPVPSFGEGDKTKAEIDKFFVQDPTPRPLQPIPDDPPPHEGAMISLPHVIEPPDLVLVEVLDALPGRPISGERLVKPDGSISLGFYGEIPVRGLTLEQVKVALIKHLRAFLDDDALGLVEYESEEMAASPPREKPALPVVPKEGDGPLDVKEKVKPRTSTYRAPSNSLRMRPRAARPSAARSTVTVRPVARTKTDEQAADNATGPPVLQQLAVPLSGSGKVTIMIQVDGQNVAVGQPVPEAPAVGLEANPRWKVVPPEKSGKVFVDITAYNSKNYFVLGDTAETGRYPCTANETVLDALQFAGGLLPTAEPKDIRLIRPARGGKPARIYKVDLAAIQEKGDVRSNYQIFPGDRLIVGRNDVVKKTVEIDRLNAPLLSLYGNMLQQAFLLRSLQFATTADRDALLKEFTDFWTNELARPGGVQFVDQTFRDALIHKMKLPPGPIVNPAPR
jgi:protein involved in polysaccharide export with SLBB domain